jgi:hypothetical protein
MEERDVLYKPLAIVGIVGIVGKSIFLNGFCGFIRKKSYEMFTVLSKH